MGLEDTQDLAAGDEAGLGYAMGVTKNIANHGRSHALLGIFADMVCNLHR